MADMGAGNLIGNWGIHIIFRVSLQKSITFRNAKKSVASRYAEHELIGNVPRLEWLGPAITEVTMDVLLTTDLGVHVRNLIGELERACRMGSAQDLWIGGKKVGSNKMVLTSIDEDWMRYYTNGELTAASNALTFREYYEGEK